MMMMMMIVVLVVLVLVMILLFLVSRGDRDGQGRADHSWRRPSNRQTGKGRYGLRQRIEEKHGCCRQGHDAGTRLLVGGGSR